MSLLQFFFILHRRTKTGFWNPSSFLKRTSGGVTRTPIHLDTLWLRHNGKTQKQETIVQVQRLGKFGGFTLFLSKTESLL
jgi:hypothetical protein